MREQFKKKTAAPNAPPTTKHTLGVGHINKLNSVAERIARMKPGTGLSGVHRGQSVAFNQQHPARLEEMRVVAFMTNAVGDIVPGIYYVQRRYWDGTTGEFGTWRSKRQQDNRDDVMDSRDFSLKYALGDIVSAWYDWQRYAWIPTERPQFCPPMLDVATSDSVNLTTTAPNDTQTGAVAFYQLEFSTDGGASWTIANNRQLGVHPDCSAGGKVTSSSFATLLVSDQTRIRLVAFAAVDGRAAIHLDSAAMRMHATCQGDWDNHGGVAVPAQSNHVVTSWVPRARTNNNVDNLLNGVPYFEIFAPNQIGVRTPRINPDDPLSPREVWMVEVEFGIQILALDYQTPLVDCNASSSRTITEGNNVEQGQHVTFMLELNNKSIQNRLFHICPMDDALCSGTGFVSFRVEDGDVIELTAYKAQNADFDAQFVRGALRLRVETDESIANANGAGGYTAINGLSKVAEINNDANTIVAGWPNFAVGAASVIVSTPDERKWTISAEFSVTVKVFDKSSSSSSSQSVSTSSSSQSGSDDQSSQSSSSSLSSGGTTACPTDDFTIVVAGIGGADCDGNGDACSAFNDTFTLTFAGGGSWTTAPVINVCNLYNWELTCLDGVMTLATMGATTRTWTGTFAGATTVLTSDGGATENCDTWPATITLTRI